MAQPFALDTRLTDILPPSADAGRAEAMLDAYSDKVNVLIGARKFAEAKAAAQMFQESIPVDAYPLPDTKDLARTNWRLLSDRARKDLQSGRTEDVRKRAQALLYSPLLPMIMPLDRDPFLLATDYLMTLTRPVGGFAPRHGVLAATVDGVTYIYLAATARNLMAGDAARIEDAAAKVRAAFPLASVNVSGVPVHGNRAMAASKKEMNVITAASAVLLIALSYALFG